MEKREVDEETRMKAQEEYLKLLKCYNKKEMELFEEERRRGLHPPNVLDGPLSEEMQILHRELNQKTKELQLKYFGFTNFK